MLSVPVPTLAVLLQGAQTFHPSAPPCVELLKFLDLVPSATVDHWSKVCFMAVISRDRRNSFKSNLSRTL